MAKSASVNIFRSIWICNTFSVTPTNIKKEDLHRAGKSLVTFAKKIKFI